MKKLLKVADLMLYFGLKSKATIYGWLRLGEFPSADLHVNRTPFWKTETLEKWQEQKKNKKAQNP